MSVCALQASYGLVNCITTSHCTALSSATADAESNIRWPTEVGHIVAVWQTQSCHWKCMADIPRMHSTTCTASCLLTLRRIHADGKCCMQECQLSTQIAVAYTVYAHTYEVRIRCAQGTYIRTGTQLQRRCSRQNMPMLTGDAACV